MIVAGVLHAQRIEDVFPEGLLVRFAGDFLNDCAQEKIAGVAVNKFCPRLEFQIAARILLDKVIHRKRVPAHIRKKSRQRRVTWNTRGVTQQIMNRDLRASVLAIVRQVIAESSVQFDFALLNQLQNQSRGELLCDRAETEFRVRLVRNVPLHIGKAQALLVNDLAVLSHQG